MTPGWLAVVLMAALDVAWEGILIAIGKSPRSSDCCQLEKTDEREKVYRGVSGRRVRTNEIRTARACSSGCLSRGHI